jgi:hypothetical protein
VQQHNAFAVLLQLYQHPLPDLVGLAQLEVKGVEIG